MSDAKISFKLSQKILKLARCFAGLAAKILKKIWKLSDATHLTLQVIGHRKILPRIRREVID